MHTLLVVLAAATGTFGFAFSTAGFLGMLDFKPHPGKSLVLDLLDEIITGGLGSILRSVAANWQDRRDERRLFYIGLANTGACLVLIFLANRIS
jgi:hypothetical protein